MYYCHNCAIRNGFLRSAVPSPLTGTQYQLEKYDKHTSPTSNYNLNTIFTGPSSVSYRSCIISTVASGHVQIDDQGRTNVVWVASMQTGITCQNGVFTMPANAVKVVYHDNPQKIHGFPIQSSELAAEACSICGCPILA